MSGAPAYREADSSCCDRVARTATATACELLLEAQSQRLAVIATTLPSIADWWRSHRRPGAAGDPRRCGGLAAMRAPAEGRARRRRRGRGRRALHARRGIDALAEKSVSGRDLGSREPNAHRFYAPLKPRTSGAVGRSPDARML